MTMQVILGNFALILFVLMVITGVIWCLDVFVLAKQRRAAANRALADEVQPYRAGVVIHLPDVVGASEEGVMLWG